MYFYKKFILIFVLLGSINSVYGQILISAFSDKLYYNATFLQNQIIIGTSEGPFVFNYKDRTVVLTKFRGSFNQPGYIEATDSNLGKGKFLASEDYKSLLPKLFADSTFTSFSHKDLVFIFVGGNLYVFKILTYDFESYPSIRSISNNYISTYGGIYDWNHELQKSLPGYSSGRVIELEEGLAICWDGLYLNLNGKTHNYYDPINHEVEIFGQKLGYARDLVMLGPTMAVLVTLKGLFEINFSKKEIQQIFEATNGIEPKIHFKSPNNEYIVFSSGNAVFRFQPKDQILDKIYVHSEEIVDISTENSTYFYLLSNSSLSIVDTFSNAYKVLLTEIGHPYNIVNFQNRLIITSNIGLHIYDLTTGKNYYNIIKDEFNKYAYYVNGNKLYLGSISGLYTLTLDRLNSLFYISEAERESILFENSKLSQIVPILLIALVVGVFLFVFQLKKRKSKVIIPNNLSLEESIRSYIKHNLATVRLRVLTSLFDINTSELYKLFNDVTPGEYIRNERLKVLKEMRKNGYSEKEISKATGFSASYLKKL